jgi:hypothetical protein
MTSTLKKDIQKQVVTAGDHGLAAAGQALFTVVGTGNNAQIIYNVAPGQLVAYTISNGVTTTVDDATLAASDIYELYIGVGIDLNNDGVTDDIRHIGIEQISGCEPREVSTSSPRCGGPQVVDFYFDCTKCDETYSVIVRIDDNQTQSFSPWNKSFSEFVGSIVTNCSSCDDCPVEHNCKEVACKLADALNNELDLRVGQQKYPDWKGKGLPRPYHATRLHSNSYIYCFSGQGASDCADCTYTDAITGAIINGTTYNFVATTNPLDGTQTLLGQVNSVVAQINNAFTLEYSQGQANVTPHAGSAYATGSYQQCCPVQLHVNTCDATFTLLDDASVAIAPQTTDNPFTTYGTVANDANCVDCGADIGTKAAGVLTLTGQPLDTETVTIGTKVYTFQTVLTNVDGNVLIGATAEDSADNLVAAINLTTGAGTDYATAMTIHPTVAAADGTGTTVDLTAKEEGVAGNLIATTETLTNGSFGAVTLENGVDGTIGSTAYVCGVRVIAEQVKGDCGFYLDKPLSFYGRKLNVLPFGDGWKGKPWRVVEVQAMELPAGFGAWIQWLEYQDLPEGRGRRFDRSNINKGWANLPGNKARVKNAVTARCDTSYCSYYMKSFVEKKRISNDYGVLTIHSNIHIPNNDATTIAAWEAFFAALIALNPSCHQLTTIACDAALGGC